MDSPTSPTQNPISLHADSIISSLLSFPDYSSPISISSSSFHRQLEKALASASDDASVQDRLVIRTIELASILLESAKRSFRKRASAHNSVSWFLPPELTVKVKSNLDWVWGLCLFLNWFLDCSGVFDAWYEVSNESGCVLHHVQQMCDGSFLLRSRRLDKLF